MKRILLISGSLRKESFNTSILRDVKNILSSQAECSFLSYDDIPYMNQDIEFDDNPSVSRVRKEVASSDGIWISSPEYNHSYPGLLKNLLDWLSRPTVAGDYSTSVIRGKTVAISSAAGSSGGSFSLSKLREFLEMMNCSICENMLSVPLGRRFGDKELILTDEERSILEKECSELISRI